MQECRLVAERIPKRILLEAEALHLWHAGHNSFRSVGAKKVLSLAFKLANRQGAVAVARWPPLREHRCNRLERSFPARQT